MTANMDEAITKSFVFFSPLCDTHGTRHLRQPMSTSGHASLQAVSSGPAAGPRQLCRRLAPWPQVTTLTSIHHGLASQSTAII
jgi:hypothetical protein